ncbi:LamG domain-containing protein [Micromonospora pisi]|nr:LamG domain-containing protein [Micromonospora pisi]
MTQVVALAEGGFRYQASVAPQRVRRADGSWAPISPDLVRQADGSLKPAATLADVSFSAGGSGPLVTWREGVSTFTLSWPLGALPVPKVSGATATYESVLSGVNLHVTATAEGYTHSVELLTPAAAKNPAVRQLRYVTGGNTRVERASDGTLRLLGSGGGVVATSGAARMWDSSSDPARAGEVLPAVAAAWASGRVAVPVGEPATAVEPAVTSRIAPVALALDGEQLTVVPDSKLLADPAVTYPVFVDPPFEKFQSKWAYATSNGENNDGTSARVGREPADTGSGELYRSFFEFVTTPLRGKKILSAYVALTLDHSYSCDSTPVTMYRTSGITVNSGGRMSWTARPLPGVSVASWSGHANETGGCGALQDDMRAEFSGTIKGDLQWALDSGYTGYTVGLCACDTNGGQESNQQRWKRFFTDKGWLEVTYDSVPTVPSNLSTSGQACGATIGTSSPVFKAYYGDADGAGDSLTGFFEYQELPSSAVVSRTGQVKPGNSYGESGAFVLGAVSEGKSYQWRVKTRDAAGVESPDWSPWCRFTVDTAKPPRPGVSSSAYPNDGVARGGPGISGAFTFTAGVQDVTRYVYGWSGSPQPMTTVTVSRGASYTVTLTPPRHGYNTLNVYSLDGADKQSDTNAYSFLVNAPSAPVANWPLDSIDAHNLTDTQGDADLSTVGSVTWAPDVRIIGESVASFNASSYLTTAGPVLDTSKSFSVAAWVRLADIAPNNPDVDLDIGNRTVLGQSGSKQSGFYLGYRTDGVQPRWSFAMHGADLDQGTTWDTANSSALVTSADVGRWVHLAATYDSATRTMQLYVNGSLAGSTARSANPWNANGPMTIGAAKYTPPGGTPLMIGQWPGEITEVRAWQRVIVPDDLLGSDGDDATGTDPVAGILAPTEVASWDFNGGLLSGCGTETSDSYWSQSLRLYGCTDPYSPEQTAGYTGDAHDDNDALWLNQEQPDGYGGSGDGNGYAATTQPIVRTDQSFTVSTWVKLARTDRDQVVLSQQGNNLSRFMLYYNQPDGRWRVWMYHEDGGSRPGSGVSGSTAVVDKWTHLTLVFDAGRATTSIYVDGVLAGITAHAGAAWNATGPFSVGRAFYGQTLAPFSGSIDQVRAFAGAMSDREVRNLYSGRTSPQAGRAGQ